MKNESINKTEVFESWQAHYKQVGHRNQYDAARLAMHKAMNATAPTVKELELDARIATMHEAIASRSKLPSSAIRLEIGKVCNLRIGQEERESSVAFEEEALEAFHRR